LAVSVVAVGAAMFFEHQKNATDKAAPDAANMSHFDEAIEVIEKVADENATINANVLHTDILRAIAAGKETICGVTPEAAKKELNQKLASSTPEKPAILKELPFDILKIIAKSSVSLAGIKPRLAINEIVRRYLSLKVDDPEGVNSAILLEALHPKAEQEAINKWDDNECAEAMDKFMKEEADRDPSSVANFAYGLKHLSNSPDSAMSYMDRFAENSSKDSFDNESAEESYNVLIDAVKKLKKPSG
jgi:hypothetical protein